MPGKKVAILQSNYIPWKGYFDIIGMVDEFIIYDEVQYTKNDWRNRNKIKTSAGIQWLTVPVYQKKLSQKISETEVSHPHWAKKNWQTIQGNYSKAAHFKSFSQPFEEFYTTTRLTSLSEINVALIRIINDILGIKTRLTDSKSYAMSGDPTERLVGICQQAGADIYLSGPAAKDYLREEVFHRTGIVIEWMDYSGYPEYPQIYPPFTHQVSVIDLIFNMGSDAASFMKFSQK